MLEHVLFDIDGRVYVCRLNGDDWWDVYRMTRDEENEVVEEDHIATLQTFGLANTLIQNL